MMTAMDKMKARIAAADSLLCVGLDSDINHLPERFLHYEYPLFVFNRWIIEQTHPYVCAYKPNIAYYEARGDRGMRSLHQTMEYLHTHHPDILTICDAKRADIGSTSAAYARAIFDWLGFDAVTLNPYLGGEALQPFLERADRISIILCRTSNPGAGELQDLQINGVPLWSMVARRVVENWNASGNCMLVMGATYSEELRALREIAPDIPLLIPGIGAQGGDLKQTVEHGCDADGRGLLVNSSRGIIFADDPEMAARQLRDGINSYRPAR